MVNNVVNNHVLHFSFNRCWYAVQLLIPTLNCCYSGFTLNLIIDCYQAYNFIVGRHTISRFNRILNDFMLRETKGHEWMNMYETSCNRLLAKSDRHVSCYVVFLPGHWLEPRLLGDICGHFLSKIQLRWLASGSSW